MRVQVPGCETSALLGPAEKISFTFSNGVRRTYRVLSYTHETYMLGHRAEVFELEPMSAAQEVVPDENVVLRLRRIRELLASNNAGQMMTALQQVDDLIDDLR